jgi:hypothetical protein
MDKVKQAWRLFNTLISRGLEFYNVPDSNRSFPKVGEIRELFSNIPFYFALVEELSFDDQNRIFKAVILTEEILLGYLNRNTPLIKLPRYKTLLVVLPVWIYLSENFLVDFTCKRGKLKNSEIDKIVKYVESTSIPANLKGEFINTVMDLFSPYNTESILNTIDAFDSPKQNTTVIRIPDEIKRYFEEKFNSQES